MKLAIGFFDGVHVGHQKIVDQADAVLTFANHPFTVLQPARVPPLLMTLEERVATLRTSVKSVRALPFTAELAAQEPVDFVAYLRTAYPDLTAIRCGDNWRFGAGGRGTARFLRAQGVNVEVIPDAVYAGQTLSSTRIRAALQAGLLADAQAMLGRYYSVCGSIVPGKGMGSTLGFPTLNVHVPNPDLPRLLPLGVYAVQTPLGAAVANWGVAPTLGERAWPAPVLEVHILAGAPAQVPPDLTVDFVRFLRPERRMASLAELQHQLAQDCAACRATLSNEKENSK